MIFAGLLLENFTLQEYMRSLPYLLVAISSAESIANTTIAQIGGPTPVTDGSSVNARKRASFEIDFKDDLLNNIIWFSSVAGSRKVYALSDTGYILSFVLPDIATTDQLQVSASLSPLLDSDGTPLTTDMYTSTGSVVSGDLTLSRGIYVSSTQSTLREFPQLSTASGVVAKSSNPIGLCDTWLSEEIATGCGEPFSVMTSLRPEDDTESVGSILFSCRYPRDEDLSIPGWACNPSNGDSVRYSVKTANSTTSLSAMSPCPACEPYQMFMLFSHSDSSGSLKSISIESIAATALVDEEGEGNRVTLFTLEVSDIVFLSLSVVPGTDSELEISLFGYNVSSPTTAYVVLSFAVDINLSTSARISSSSGDYSLSVFILFLLLCIGIAVPFLIRFNPHIRARIENVRWLKHAEQIGLVGDSGNDSDPEDVVSVIPKKFGHLSPNHTPKKLNPINESDISGS